MFDRQREAADRTLAGLQQIIEPVVRDALRQVADTVTAALADLDYDLQRLPSMAANVWRDRFGDIIEALLAVWEAAARAAADLLGFILPAGYRNLPGGWRDGRDLPAPVNTYIITVTVRLGAVADTLSEQLTPPVEATPEDTRAAIEHAATVAASPARAQRIAATETMLAYNGAVADTATVIAPADRRPRTKTWLTMRDAQVRAAHRHVDAVSVPVGDRFIVAGVPMDGPGDPTAPLDLIVNCRCVLLYGDGDDMDGAFPTDDEVQQMSNRYRPGRLTAADTEHTGAIIALMPSDTDARRLAVDSGEPADQLHMTLLDLGDADQWTDQARRDLADAIAAAAATLTAPTYGRAFGAAQWDVGADTPAWVWSVGDDPDRKDDSGMLLAAVQQAAVSAAETGPEIPDQYTPWIPHVTAAYSNDDLRQQLLDRIGPIRFDRIRLWFAGEHVDIGLGTDLTAADDPADPEGPDKAAPVTWSTPGDTAIAFEDTETGDGRIFAPGALYWQGGPWPLQYAEEMLAGHDGAELAGAIHTLGRDGRRVTAAGVLYPSRSAGRDAIELLAEGAPLGVSVDLDDVDVELVDRSGERQLLASLAQASILRHANGAYTIRASHTIGDLTASGVHTATTVTITTGDDGSIPAAPLLDTLTAAGIPVVDPAAEIEKLRASLGMTAAAGDPDQPDQGEIVHAESSGTYLMRVTRARVRGATLVAVPAFADARISLDTQQITAADTTDDSTRIADVIVYVSGSPVPVDAATVAAALHVTTVQARDMLARAAADGRIVRLARGLYVGAATLPETRPEPLTAAATPDNDGDDDGDGDELVASAWRAMQSLPPMPAEWFREPSRDELPDGAPGVHYKDGRIFGWVAKAGEPHASYPGRKVTIESLGKIDLTHFLRQKFELDDGSQVKAGAMTMNTGHHRDGAECETAACQFDSTRTVAGIVTVGVNKRGMWFSGAAGPHLSDWDRTVFAACQPSYHLRQGPGGRWQLRAVLSVPVPGHSTPLLASTVVERSNLALAASAALPDTLTASDTPPAAVDVAAIAAAVVDELQRRGLPAFTASN